MGNIKIYTQQKLLSHIDKTQRFCAMQYLHIVEITQSYRQRYCQRNSLTSTHSRNYSVIQTLRISVHSSSIYTQQKLLSHIDGYNGWPKQLQSTHSRNYSVIQTSQQPEANSPSTHSRNYSVIQTSLNCRMLSDLHIVEITQSYRQQQHFR